MNGGYLFVLLVTVGLFALVAYFAVRGRRGRPID